MWLIWKPCTRNFMNFTKVCAVSSNNYVSPNAKRCDKMNAIFILIATLKWCETARAVATFFQHLNDNRQSSRARMSSKLSTREFSLDLTHFRVDFFFSFSKRNCPHLRNREINCLSRWKVCAIWKLVEKKSPPNI